MSAPLVTGALSDLLFVLGVYAFAALVLLAALFGTAYRMILYDATFGGGETPPEEKTNCPSCGARTTVDPPACDHCGEPLRDDEPPSYGRTDDRTET